MPSRTRHAHRSASPRPLADKGQLVRSGGPELALELERDGYAFLGEDQPAFRD